jgi:hypothetical protein
MSSQVEYYHYTYLVKLEHIITSKKIRCSKAGVAIIEKPTVWVSTNHVWEKTVNAAQIDPKSMIPSFLTFHETNERYGAARIKVTPSIKLITWKKYKHVSRIDPDTYDRLEQVGRSVGANPDEWYAHFGSVYRPNWESIEVWNGNEWMQVDPDYYLYVCEYARIQASGKGGIA